MPLFGPNDDTLSGGEVAMARIVQVLVADWDRLDGQQQRALVKALETSAKATEHAEAWVQEHISNQ